jgi:SAM-dependent methyltransferase
MSLESRVAELRRSANHLLGSAKNRIGGWRARGNTVECPCCGSRFETFKFDRAPNRVCWTCGSYERERAIWLLWDREPSMLRPGMSLLHIAPEPTLVRRLSSIPNVTYIGGDIDGRFARRRLDVTDLSEFADGHFDAVICNHVLEHVPDDRKAMHELRRVLRPGGWALLLTPLTDGETDEDLTITDPAVRAERFRQHDHVRLYGRDDYLHRLRSAGFEPALEYARDIAGPENVDRFALRLGDEGVVIGHVTQTSNPD